MKRRTFLKGSAFTVAGLTAQPLAAHYEADGRQLTPSDLGASIARMRKQ